MVEVVFDPQTSATLIRTNVESFVSDSGITQYKFITANWMTFERASDPYWYFPDKIYIEKFDTFFNVEATIKADTAYYYDRRSLMKLIGNVDITNVEGQRFQTSELFWDRQKETVYSDSFIRVTDGDKVQMGIGFTSNQNLTVYTIFNPSAEIPVEMQRHTLASDSISSDSLATNARMNTN